MDTVEQAPAKKVAEVTPEPEHTICKNCGYHDPQTLDKDGIEIVPARCPACYFRHASEPVHQAPVEAEAPKAEEEVKAADLIKVANVVDTEDKPADEPAARVVEKIVIVEKAPTAEAIAAALTAAEAIQGDSEH